jgi:hypothetical protein
MPKKSKLTEEQVTFARRQAEPGLPVADVCGKLGVIPKRVDSFSSPPPHGGRGRNPCDPV